MIPITIRPSVPADLSYVYHSWINKQRYSPSARFIHEQLYRQQQHQLIDRILTQSAVLVGCNPEDASQVYGYVVRGNPYNHCPVIHWLQVKDSYQKFGFARQLLTAAAFDAVSSGRTIYTTHASNVFNSRELIAKYNLVYFPFLLHGYQ